MSKHRSAWWNYIKQILLRYPNISEKEKEAIDKTIAHFRETGKPEKIQFINLVYFKKITNVEGIQNYMFISNTTAIRWNGEIYRHIAMYLGLIDRPIKEAVISGNRRKTQIK